MHGLSLGKTMIKMCYIFVREIKKLGLYSTGALITDVNWIASTKPIDKIACNAKFRYRQPDNPIQLEFIDEDTVYLTFDKPIKAVTPGQAAVFYDGDICLGGEALKLSIKMGKPTQVFIMIGIYRFILRRFVFIANLLIISLL